jgi:hypothetical protein
MRPVDVNIPCVESKNHTYTRRSLVSQTIVHGDIFRNAMVSVRLIGFGNHFARAVQIFKGEIRM